MLMRVQEREGRSYGGQVGEIMINDEPWGISIPTNSKRRGW